MSNEDRSDDDEDKTFEDPQLAINRVYTRKGDAGQTALVGGQRVPKTSARIAAYGTVDELNAVVGTCRQALLDDHADNAAFDELGRTLLRVQHELFNLGSILATLPDDVGEKMPRVSQDDITALEASMDLMNEELPALRSFVLPGGSRLNAQLHLARTVCRRAERKAVALAESEEVDPDAIAYLNRLSDAFFVWSRWASVKGSGADEVLWDPNMSASGSS
jgi:cob(I)alamin adenosyltransferase